MQLKSNVFAITAAAAVLSLLQPDLARAAAEVYTSSNLSSGNTVIRLAQSDDGTLAFAGEYATGGSGTDGGLGNQGAIAIDDEFLFVVNAGSNQVSSFRLLENGLELVDVADSGGMRPVSLTVDRDVLYVLNADSDNISGFDVTEYGELIPIEGSTQPLSGVGTAPAQVSFSKDGRTLVVTEKATNRLVSFSVDRDGIAADPQVFASPGATPFGFSFTNGNRLLVSEAEGGAPGQSSVTAWKLSPFGDLQTVDPVVPTLQSAACWLAVTPNGRFAYTGNTGGSNISAFRVRGDELSLVIADGVNHELAISPGTDSRPIDLATTPDGQFLLSLNMGDDTISSFRINEDGSLEEVDQIGGLPDRPTGLVAR